MTDSTVPYPLKPTQAEKRPGRRKSNRGSNGYPPSNNLTGGNDVRNRAEAAEKTLPDLKERLVRVETKLDSIENTTATKMATKTDLADLKISMLECLHSQTKWFIGTAAVLAGVACAAARLIQ